MLHSHYLFSKICEWKVKNNIIRVKINIHTYLNGLFRIYLKMSKRYKISKIIIVHFLNKFCFEQDCFCTFFTEKQFCCRLRLFCFYTLSLVPWTWGANCTSFHTHAPYITAHTFTFLLQLLSFHLPHGENCSSSVSLISCLLMRVREYCGGVGEVGWFDLQVFPREHKDLSTGR